MGAEIANLRLWFIGSRFLIHWGSQWQSCTINWFRRSPVWIPRLGNCRVWIRPQTIVTGISKDCCRTLTFRSVGLAANRFSIFEALIRCRRWTLRISISSQLHLVAQLNSLRNRFPENWSSWDPKNWQRRHWGSGEPCPRPWGTGKQPHFPVPWGHFQYKSRRFNLECWPKDSCAASNEQNSLVLLTPKLLLLMLAFTGWQLAPTTKYALSTSKIDFDFKSWQRFL